MRRPASTEKKRTISESKMNDDDNSNEEITSPHSKRRCSRANGKAVEVSQSQIYGMQDLEKELQKEKPDKKYVKNAMKTTYQARRKWVLEECPPMSVIMDKYPVLKKQAYVCHFVYVMVIIIIIVYLQLRREAQYVLEEYKHGYDFGNAKEKMDVLYGQVQAQIQLEANSSKTIKAILEKLPTDEGTLSIIIHISFYTWHTGDENVKGENTIALLSQLLNPKSKDKILHQISVS